MFEGDITKIKSGEAVEFILSDNKKNMLNDRGLSAACVRLVKSESIKMPEILPTIYKGVVRRALRHFNSDQNEYSGLVEVLNGSSGNNEQEIEDALVPSVDKGTGVQYHYGKLNYEYNFLAVIIIIKKKLFSRFDELDEQNGHNSSWRSCKLSVRFRKSDLQCGSIEKMAEIESRCC